MSVWERDRRICRDCGLAFELSAGERRFFASKDLSLPSRCVHCRTALKAGKQFVKDTGIEWAPGS